MFVIGFLVTRNLYHLNQLSKRVIFAILLSIAGFLLFPLHLGFQKPVIEGFFKPLYDILTWGDLPYNQFPSLHISLGLLFWHVMHHYLQRPIYKILNMLLFFAIGLSTLTTYQHHVIDIPGGVLVGLLSLYFFPNHTQENHYCDDQSKLLKIGGSYAVLAIVLWFIAAYYGSWLWCFAYPALTFTLVAAAYCFKSHDFTQKQAGFFPAITLFFLGPYLIIVKIVWYFYARNNKALVGVTERIYFGRRLSQAEFASLSKYPTSVILDLAPEISTRITAKELQYTYVPLLDFVHPNHLWLLRVSKEIAAAVARQKVIYIQCTFGSFRSVIAVGAYLVSTGQSVERVAAILKERSPLLWNDTLAQILTQFQVTLDSLESPGC